MAPEPQHVCRPIELLLIEDNPVDVLLFRLALADEPYSINLRVASSGQEAMRMLPEERPDLVILDLNLPQLSGLSFLERNRTTVPVVVFSCSCCDDDIRRSFELGARDFVPKASDLDTYMRLVSYIVRTWGVPELPMA